MIAVLIAAQPEAPRAAVVDAVLAWNAAGFAAYAETASQQLPLGGAWWRLAALAACDLSGRAAPELLPAAAGVLPASGAPSAPDHAGWRGVQNHGAVWGDLDAVDLQRLPGADAWGLLVHETARPTAGLLDALVEAAAEGPALLCCREVFSDGRRCSRDWRDRATREILPYSIREAAAYGDSGALCLPLRALHRALLYVAPSAQALGGGVNIALAGACDLIGLPTRLVDGTLVLEE